jgi:MYXO-CTERM domain-containing protein
VHRGGDRFGTGTVIFAGTTSGGESFTVDLEIDTTWDEGDNNLYVVQTGSNQMTGHARGTVFVDNPPKPPTLAADGLTFGDRKLILAFDGIDDLDLVSYEVYVSDADFDSDTFETDGPTYTLTRFSSPLTVSSAPGASVTVDLTPLKNDIKHYVAVRATDEGGLVGPMSNTINGTPRPAYTAAELAGETGGGPLCATTPGTAGWFALALAALAGLRRRSKGLVLVAALAPVTALAANGEGLERDMTKQSGDFEMRYGGMSLTDPILQDVYREAQSNILQVEFGPQFFRIFEIDAGVGFLQELSHKVDTNGNSSGERTMLTWWPALALDGTARLHLLDEQLIVPYVRGGFDWVIWSEKSDNASGSKDVVRGNKFGNHFGIGGSLLLDVLQRKRASLLEAQTGINDTYLTFEWRRQRIDQRDLPWSPGPATIEGLDFSGTMFTVGLKLDY